MLKALELVGFKSFADKTRFEFPPGITVIVGPNGSGKSNIVDAIKWVLGEQSAKSLRGKDMADVIFKGAGAGEGGRRPLNSAEATLVLDNADRRFDVDAGEIHVTRRVYRSGEGEYLVNGEPCRLKDIRDLFRGTGVGTDAYSLIEQGKVDQMLQASAKDRRAIFEEAAGISRFKAKKVEAQRRLARVEQNLVRLADIVEEVERRFRSVKAQASKAARYQKASSRLKLLRTHLGVEDWHRFADRLAEIEAHGNQLTAEVDEKTTAVSNAENIQQSADRDLGKLRNELAESESRLADLREELAGLDSTVRYCHTRSGELREEESRLRRESLQLRKQANEFDREVNRNAEQLIEAELAHAAASEQVDELAATVERLDQSLSAGAEAEQEREKQLRELQQTIAQLEKEIGVDGSRREQSQQAAERLSEQIETAELDCVQLQQDIDSLTSRVQELARDAELKDSDLAGARERLDSDRKQLAADQESLAELKSDLTGATRRAEVIEELEQRLEGVHSGVRQLIEQSRSEQAAGAADVIGLVADLIRVDVEHAPLIDVALGDVTQHVVITGDRLIGELIRGELQLTGRVGLIRLEEISAPPRKEAVNLIGQPGIVGAAADLVQTQPEHEAIVQHLLGSTWIVKTLEDAFRLRSERSPSARFVTLTGQLLESDGTIIAGPRAAAGGLVSRRSELRSLKAQIISMQRQIESRQLDVNELQQHVAEHESLVRQLMEEHSELASALSDQRIMAKAAGEKLTETQSRRDSLQKECEDHLQLIRETSQRIEQMQSDLGAAGEGIQRLEAARLEQQRRREADERERSESRDRLTAARVELAKTDQQLEGLQQQAARIQEEQGQRCQAVNAVDDQLDECLKRLAESDREILQATGRIAERQLAKQTIHDTHRSVRLECNRLQQARREAGDRLERLRSALRVAEQEMHRLELEAGKLEHERQTVAERLRDDYGIELDQADLSEEFEEESTREEMEAEVQELRRKINAMGAVNMESLNELTELEARFGALGDQYNDLQAAKDSLAKIIERINADSRKLFKETLEAIRVNFQTLYRKSFGGGRADLVVEEGVDILEAGIDIIATPPGKPEFNNSLLSGGEKALTAVALLLAIFQYRPSPFCVLDEVDAPFDEANIGRFIDVLNGFLEWTRFVIVTHSKKTMTAATTLYGVTMQESGVSKRVSVRFEDVSDDGHISANAANESSAGEIDRGVA